PLYLQSAQARHAAFLDGLRAHGIALEPGMIQEGNHRVDGGARAMGNLLKLPSCPTAVMASNDLTAIGALHPIHEADLRVAEDISLVGFDDITFAQLTQPALTTIRVSRRDLAITVFTALEQLTANGDHEQSDYSIPTHLVQRKSTKAIEA